MGNKPSGTTLPFKLTSALDKNPAGRFLKPAITSTKTADVPTFATGALDGSDLAKKGMKKLKREKMF